MKNTFSGLNLKKEIIDALNEINFYVPTKIQSLVIPKARKGLSIVGISNTGSGKSHAFIVPILETINPHKKDLQATIVAPTRELALQLHQKVVQASKYMNLNVKLITGGTDVERQKDFLKNKPQIIVATPNRLNDLISIKDLNFADNKTIVLDEVDMMIDLGFADIITNLLNKIPVNTQIMAFSATIHLHLRNTLAKFFNNAEIIEVRPEDGEGNNVTHYWIDCKEKDKNDVLLKFVKIISPYIALIFCNSRQKVDEVKKLFVENNLKCFALHGGLKPRERKNILKNITQYQYIICSDVASRGFDVEGITDVISLEIPDDPNWYIHRSGRTGRYTHKGNSYVLLKKEDKKLFQKILDKKIKFIEADLANDKLNVKKITFKVDPKKIVSPMEKEIRKVINRYKSKKVKPNWRKDMQEEIRKIKQKEKRKYIELQVKKQLLKQNIERTKAMKKGNYDKER